MSFLQGYARKLGVLEYKGVWNASTNQPSLSSSSGNKGEYYIISVAGSSNLDGESDWQPGDWVVFNGSVWQKIDTTDLVQSVAGKTGVVTLLNSDVGLSNVPNVDATLRINHTGTQTASTISDFDSAADARITLQKGDALGLATLDSGGKVPSSQLPSTIMEFKGTWNASTNTPTLADGNPPNAPEDAGHVYVVSTGGTVNLGSGSITFSDGDWVILNASLVWEKSVNSNTVVSVNGHQGVVVLTKDDVGLSSVDNVSAASLRDRSTHTGTQLASTISDFTTAVQAVTIDAAKIDGGVVSNAEFATLDGITTGVSIQSQINGKEPSIAAGTTAQYYRGDKTFQTLDKTAVGLSNVDDISAANLRDRTTHTGSESTLSWSEVAEPSAPASGVIAHANGSYGRQMLGQVPKAGRPYQFHPFFGTGRHIQVQANPNTISISSFGVAAPTASGTITARTIATTSHYTWQRRVGYVSAITNNSAAGIRQVNLVYGLGNAANTGGFHFVARFGISDAVLAAGARTFVGLTGTTTALGNNDPSNFLNHISIGHDGADTTLQIMHNGATGTATKINLGANFPCNTVSTDMYEVSFFCAPNTTTVYYYVENLRTGAVASGTITNTAKLPATNQLLAWQIWRHNATSGVAVGIDIVTVYIENDY